MYWQYIVKISRHCEISNRQQIRVCIKVNYFISFLRSDFENLKKIHVFNYFLNIMMYNYDAYSK